MRIVDVSLLPKSTKGHLTAILAVLFVAVVGLVVYTNGLQTKINTLETDLEAQSAKVVVLEEDIRVMILDFEREIAKRDGKVQEIAEDRLGLELELDGLRALLSELRLQLNAPGAHPLPASASQ